MNLGDKNNRLQLNPLVIRDSRFLMMLATNDLFYLCHVNHTKPSSPETTDARFFLKEMKKRERPLITFSHVLAQ